MKKGKQILAIIGIILLIVLYLSTLVCAITDNTGTMKMFKASIFATFVIPVPDLGLYVPIQTYAQEIIIFLLFL